MEKLIHQCISGDKEASRQFVELFTPLIKATVKHTLNVYSSSTSHDPEDLQNGLFLHLMEDNWRGLRQFKGKSKLSTYIRVITVRYVISYLRKHKQPHLSIESDEVAKNLPDPRSSGNQPNAFSEKEEALHILNMCIELLKPQEQLLLKLAIYKELPSPTICQLIHITASAFYNRKSRIIKKIQDCARKQGLPSLID